MIGPSGCGKSTLVRCINRMHEEIPGARATGEVRLDDTDLYDDGVDVVSVRRAVGMVFQKPNPFPTMSIFDNVAAGLRSAAPRRATRASASSSPCAEPGLWEEVKDRLNQPGIGLSGGQQQRLCIARTIAVEPEVILMDEPCSALDPIATLKIEELIHELKQRYTIVIVTHNMQQAARVADTTAFMLTGEMVEHARDRQDLLDAGRQPDGGVRHREVRLAHVHGRGTPSTSRRSCSRSRNPRWAGSTWSSSSSTACSRRSSTRTSSSPRSSSSTTTASTGATSRSTRASSRCWRARRRSRATCGSWRRCCT